MAVQRRQQQCQWKEPQENRSPSFLNQAVLLTYRQLAKGGMMTKPQKGAIRLGIMAKEEAELAGRRPHPAARALAGIPKLIGFHIGR